MRTRTVRTRDYQYDSTEKPCRKPARQALPHTCKVADFLRKHNSVFSKNSRLNSWEPGNPETRKLVNPQHATRKPATRNPQHATRNTPPTKHSSKYICIYVG